MDRSMLTEIHGKNANGKTQNNTAQKDQTDDPLERLHADQCSIWLTLTRLDFARLSLLPWFKGIIMEQCAKCSSCQQGRTLLLLTDVHYIASSLDSFILFLMDTVFYHYTQIFVVDGELDRKETRRQTQSTTQNFFLINSFSLTFRYEDITV